MRDLTRMTLFGATALAGFAALPHVALAQVAETPAPTAPAANAQVNDGDIIVTARRRDESIIDVPLAITVVGEQKLEQLNITTTAELANYVPGLQFSDFTPATAATTAAARAR